MLVVEGMEEAKVVFLPVYLNDELFNSTIYDVYLSKLVISYVNELYLTVNTSFARWRDLLFSDV